MSALIQLLLDMGDEQVGALETWLARWAVKLRSGRVPPKRIVLPRFIRATMGRRHRNMLRGHYLSHIGNAFMYWYNMPEHLKEGVKVQLRVFGTAKFNWGDRCIVCIWNDEVDMCTPAEHVTLTIPRWGEWPDTLTARVEKELAR